MTPVYCDITGKLILPAYGTKEPELNRDYYIVFNRIVSEEGMKKVNEIAYESIKANVYARTYSFRARQELIKRIVNQFCVKLPNELPRKYYTA